MGKTIYRSRVALMVEAALHDQRLKACGDDKLLIEKEEERFDSNPLWVSPPDIPGTLEP